MALLKDFIAKGLLASRPAGAVGTKGQLYYVTDAAARRITIDNGDGTWTDMVFDAAYSSGAGTVTSVALTVPADLAVAGSPITGAGTLAITRATQSANFGLFGPTTGAADVPAYRALVDADVPNVLTTQDDLIVGGAAGARTRLGKGTDGQVLTVDPTTHHLIWATPAAPGTGTVTSVALSTPGVLYSVSGSPITGAGTLALALINQSANQVLGGPVSGLAAAPAFRALDDADIPNVMTTQDDLVIGGAAGVRTRLAKGTDGQVLTVDPATHHLVWATPASGSGSVTSVSGTAPVAVATGTTTPVISVPAFVASGASHAAGLVPDPGAVAGSVKFLREDGGWAVPAGGGGSGLYSAYISCLDQQNSGVSGGTFTSGAWRTRVLNTKSNDAGGHCALASNQMTLDAGTYRIWASAPGYAVYRHVLRLQNVTAATTILSGQSAMSGPTEETPTPALLSGRFTIAASQALEIQHQCQQTKTTNGLGLAQGDIFAVAHEVFTMVELWKES